VYGAKRIIRQADSPSADDGEYGAPSPLGLTAAITKVEFADPSCPLGSPLGHTSQHVVT